MYSFIAFSLHDPKHARKHKDGFLSVLRSAGLNERGLDAIEGTLIHLVDRFEELWS